MIICPICETDNDPGIPECILCGAPLEAPEEPEPPQEVAAPEPPAVEPPPPVAPPPPQVPVELPDVPAVPDVPAAPEPPKPLFPEPTPPSLDDLAAPPPSSFSAPMPPSTPIQAPPAPMMPSAPSTMPSPPAETPSVEIPSPGTLCLIVYFQRRPSLYYPVIYDEILVGRQDPASNSYPDLDLTPYDPDLAISRKHCYLYRENDQFYIYPISNSGTQINQEMVDIGTKKRIKEGDVVILSGRLAIRFARTT